ncbi:hypothetical protein PanWU01x14_256880, partial [Parasponia andersonii]
MSPKPLTQLCHHFLLPVGKHTFKAFLVSSSFRHSGRNDLIRLCFSPCIRDQDGAGISLDGWPSVSCWTSASKSSLHSLLASLASSPSRQPLSLRTSATSSFKPMTASWAISTFQLASANAESIWSSICSSPGCTPRGLPSASGGFLSALGRVLLVVIVE